MIKYGKGILASNQIWKQMFHMCLFSSVNPNILRPPPFLYSSSLVLPSILTPLERSRTCNKGQEQNTE